jgi:hypothetical protein
VKLLPLSGLTGLRGLLATLDADFHLPGNSGLARCAPRHRVLMNFTLAKDGWLVSFLEEDCRTSVPRHFVFQSELKILDLARHGGAEFNLAGRQAIEHGISMGRGSVWLKLTREQYAKLRMLGSWLGVPIECTKVEVDPYKGQTQEAKSLKAEDILGLGGLDCSTLLVFRARGFCHNA